MSLEHRTVFIARFMERFNHKVIRELEERLPEQCCVSEQCAEATRIIHELTEEA
jgi:hypothetical protein